MSFLLSPPALLLSSPTPTSSHFGVLTYFKIWFRSLPGSRLEEAPENTGAPSDSVKGFSFTLWEGILVRSTV